MKRPIARTTREPDGDLRAQVRAVADPRHPKDTAFVARGSRVPPVPAGVKRADRPEGTLLTTSPAKARRFASMDDAGVGKALGYPESKAKAMRDPGPVIQARDRADAVVTEAAASRTGATRTAKALAKHVPPGGRLVATTPQAAQVRRSMKP
jgi:hypothetical protein